MYQKFNTPALVIETFRYGESDRLIRLFTRQYGMIYARVAGLRRMRSKLRYSLNPYSLSEITLVYGRGGWRLTQARQYEDLFVGLRDKPTAQQVLSRIGNLCGRLFDESPECGEVFDVLVTGFIFMRTLKSKREIKALEKIMVLRLLTFLGLLKQKKPLQPFVVGNQWDRELLNLMQERSSEAVQEINRSFVQIGV